MSRDPTRHIASHVGLWDNRKFKRLQHVLGVDEVQLCGHLHSFWHNTVNQADIDTGKLLNWDAFDIALAARWKGDAQKFCDALVKERWLDLTDGVFAVHDWREYGGLGWTQTIAARERKVASRLGISVREYRAAVANGDIDADGTPRHSDTPHPSRPVTVTTGGLGVTKGGAERAVTDDRIGSDQTGQDRSLVRGAHAEGEADDAAQHERTEEAQEPPNPAPASDPRPRSRTSGTGQTATPSAAQTPQPGRTATAPAQGVRIGEPLAGPVGKVVAAQRHRGVFSMVEEENRPKDAAALLAALKSDKTVTWAKRWPILAALDEGVLLDIMADKLPSFTERYREHGPDHAWAALRKWLDTENGRYADQQRAAARAAQARGEPDASSSKPKGPRFRHKDLYEECLVVAEKEHAGCPPNPDVSMDEWMTWMKNNQRVVQIAKRRLGERGEHAPS